MHRRDFVLLPSCAGLSPEFCDCIVYSGGPWAGLLEVGEEEVGVVEERLVLRPQQDGGGPPVGRGEPILSPPSQPLAQAPSLGHSTALVPNTTKDNQCIPSQNVTHNSLQSPAQCLRDVGACTGLGGICPPSALNSATMPTTVDVQPGSGLREAHICRLPLPPLKPP